MSDINTASYKLLAAFENRSALMPLAISLAKNPIDAEELLAATFYRALTRLAMFDAKRSIAPWLKMIMKNLWKDERKSCRCARTISLDQAIEDGDEAVIFALLPESRETGPAAAFEREHTADAVRGAVAGLKRHHFTMIERVVIKRGRYQTTADHLQVSIGTVRSRLSRAKNHLRKELGRQA